MISFDVEVGGLGTWTGLALAIASWAHVPVAGGSANVTDLSVHALGGLGFASGR